MCAENGVLGNLAVYQRLTCNSPKRLLYGSLVQKMRKRVPVAVVLNQEAANNCHAYACENDQPSLHWRNVHRSLPLFVRDDTVAIREIRFKKRLAIATLTAPVTPPIRKNQPEDSVTQPVYL
jgi:hypothetical protein